VKLRVRQEAAGPPQPERVILWITFDRPAFADRLPALIGPLAGGSVEWLFEDIKKPPPPLDVPLLPVTIAEFRRWLGLRTRPRMRLRRQIERAFAAELRREFIAELRAEGLKVVSRSPDRIIAFDEPADWPESLQEASEYLALRASQVLAAAPSWIIHHELFDPEDHVQLAAAFLAAVQLAIEQGAADTFRRHDGWLNLTSQRVPYREQDNNRLLLDALGIPRPTTFESPVPGLQGGESLEAAWPKVANAVQASTTGFFEALPEGPTGLLISALYHQAIEELLGAVSGEPEALRYEFPEEEMILLASAHHDLWPAPETPTGKIHEYVLAGADLLRRRGGGLPAPSALRAIAATVGVRLVGPRGL